MGHLFVSEKLIDPCTVSVDSASYPGIDTDARWGKCGSKDWLFGYKLHVVSSTRLLIVALSAVFRTAWNV